MKWTYATIPVKCAECNAECEGMETIMSHILDFHLGYTPDEAVQYARLWAEQAYENAEEEEANYNKDQAYQRGLNKLRRKP